MVAHLGASKGKFLYSAVSGHQDGSEHFTLYSLADKFNQTPSQLLCEAFKHAAINAQRLLIHKYPPLSTARYSFIELSEVEQCMEKKCAQGFNTAVQDLNLGPLSQESEALSLSH